jgi:peptide methionine sulfoxide reductase MsrA
LTFWLAEDYHQDYITNHPEGTCHARVPRFEEEQ